MAGIGAVNHAEFPARREGSRKAVGAVEVLLARTEWQFVDQVAGDAVGGGVEPDGLFAFAVEGVFGGFASFQIADIAGPDPGELIRETIEEAALAFESERVVLMAGTVGGVGDGGIVREGARIGDRLVEETGVGRSLEV